MLFFSPNEEFTGVTLRRESVRKRKRIKDLENVPLTDETTDVDKILIDLRRFGEVESQETTLFCSCNFAKRDFSHNPFSQWMFSRCVFQHRLLFLGIKNFPRD